MKGNNFWKWALVVFLVAWSLYEISPPTNRDLIKEFRDTAINKDPRFTTIADQAQTLAANTPEKAYSSLVTAIGTNDIRGYFSMFNIQGETSPTTAILNRLQKKAAGKIKLGLDLKGGTQFTVELGINTNKVAAVGTNNVNVAPAVAEQERTRLISQAIEVLRRRVDKFGVAEPVIQPSGNNRILIQLPGLGEAGEESARKQIQKAAFLEFRMVHPNSGALLEQGIPEPGYEVLSEKVKNADGTRSLQRFLVKKGAERGLTGSNIKHAYVTMDPISNRPEILFALDKKGAETFAQVTRENIGRQLAIVLDGELYSAPTIQSEIPNGEGRITLGGSGDVKEAYELANVLENPLETPVHIVESRKVDPSLGRDTIQSAIRASWIGIILVSGFMLVYYMKAGLVANVALLTNILITVGVMASLNTTITLPGIAGIVLTVGMAVDANVLIYERIREELRAGKSMRGALNAGYDRAFGTIFDSHLTTLISSVILIYLGTGPVKGFGVSLTIGVALSLFTALVVTRLIFDWMLSRNMLNTLPMLHLVPSTLKIDFMRLAKPAFIISWAIIIVGVGYGFKQGDKILGVDFKGGDELTLAFVQKVPSEDVRRVVEKVAGESNIQYQRNLSTGTEVLRIASAFNTGKPAEDALRAAFPQAKFTQVGLDTVGAVVGKEIQSTALLASFLALFGILVYVAFRYEFSFAVGAVVAVVHDILMTLGIFFLSGRQMSAPMVAAVLTIIGFSINDTIVIFDRIREDLKLGVRGSFRDILNQALNQTLSRTLITSGTVLLATLALYLFGGPGINDFAFTFLVGILTGTYSSIYIASALVLWWHKGERPTIGTPSKVVLHNNAPGSAGTTGAAGNPAQV